MNEVIKILKTGGIGVMPTDTIYGLVGSALNRKTVERIYKVRRRNPKKPLIILIGSLADLKLFGIKPNVKMQRILRRVWPGPVSVILSCKSKKFAYLHRGTKTLAFRLPKKKGLLSLLKETGPLVAHSANWEGQPPAKNIREAKKYFGEEIDFYRGKIDLIGRPSKLIKVFNQKILILRK